MSLRIKIELFASCNAQSTETMHFTFMLDFIDDIHDFSQFTLLIMVEIGYGYEQ